jgi:hypothetical protein
MWYTPHNTLDGPIAHIGVSVGPFRVQQLNLCNSLSLSIYSSSTALLLLPQSFLSIVQSQVPNA